MAENNLQVTIDANFKRLYIASKELLDNYTHWLETSIPANEKESERLYTNLKKIIEKIESTNL